MKNQIVSVLFVLTMLMSTEQAWGMKAPPTTVVRPDEAATETKGPVIATTTDDFTPLFPTIPGRLSGDGKKSTISAEEEKTLLADIERDKANLSLLCQHAIKAAAFGSITAVQDLLNRERFRPYLADTENKDGQALARKLFASAGYNGYAEICELLLPFTRIDKKTFFAVLHGKLFLIAQHHILRFKDDELQGILYAALQDALADQNLAACDFILGKLSSPQARMVLTDRTIFSLAAENGVVAMVQRCLTSGIKPDVPVGIHAWETALYAAAQKERIDVCTVLIKARAKVFVNWAPEIQAFIFGINIEE